MLTQEGGCLCGDLRFRTTSQPIRVTVCHCRFCQRATGSAYLVEPILPQTSFEFVKGTVAVYDHCSEGSGKIVKVHFCRKCGTKLYLTFERFPGVVGVYGGTFDDPDWFERSGQNARHIFVGAAQRSTIIPAGVNIFREHAITNSGDPIEPIVFDRPYTIGS